jgi:CRP-like cAMP-binding protein
MDMTDCHPEELPIFAGLKPEEVQSFIRHTAAVVKQYEKKDRLLEAYEENDQLGIIVQGTAQILTEDWLGNENVGHRLERGALVGVNSAILSAECSGSAVEAITPMQVIWIPYRALLVSGPRLGRIHGIVMKHILEALARKNLLMVEKMELLSKKTLRERLIIYLVQREKWQKSERVQVPGRVQLARELDCNRSALTREIGLMQEEGLLEAGPDWLQLVKERILSREQ